MRASYLEKYMDRLRKRQGKPRFSAAGSPGGRRMRSFTPRTRYSMRGLRLFAVLLALMGATGCGGSRPGGPSEDLVGRVRPPVTAGQADSLAALVRRQGANLYSIRGSGDLFLRETPDSRPRKLGVQLAVRRTGEARLRGRYGVLATIFDLRVAADTLELYFPRDGVLVSGPLARWRQAPFPGAGQLVELLLPRLPEATSDSAAAWRAGDEGWTLTQWQITAPGETLECRQTYEPKRLRLVRQVFAGHGPGAGPPLVVNYDRHRWTGTGWFPEVVAVRAVGQPESCELRFASSSLNGEIPGAVFQLLIPADARRVEPEELSRRLIDEPGENEP